LNTIKQRTTLRLFRAVILDTPVLEGTLRSDWQITTDSPAKGHGTVDPLSSMTALIGASELKQPIFLTNNMPYAYGIEFEGWSTVKAPQGMMRKNAIRFDSILKQEIRRVTSGTK
jgi:hypothetical protein